MDSVGLHNALPERSELWPWLGRNENVWARIAKETEGLGGNVNCRDERFDKQSFPVAQFVGRKETNGGTENLQCKNNESKSPVSRNSFEHNRVCPIKQPPLTSPQADQLIHVGNTSAMIISSFVLALSNEMGMCDNAWTKEFGPNLVRCENSFQISCCLTTK